MVLFPVEIGHCCIKKLFFIKPEGADKVFRDDKTGFIRELIADDSSKVFILYEGASAQKFMVFFFIDEAYGDMRCRILYVESSAYKPSFFAAVRDSMSDS